MTKKKLMVAWFNSFATYVPECMIKAIFKEWRLKDNILNTIILYLTLQGFVDEKRVIFQLRADNWFYQWYRHLVGQQQQYQYFKQFNVSMYCINIIISYGLADLLNYSFSVIIF
eukprot:TRINITY_DN1183_c0_g1_i2.p4 TRINITY_DN1183_c0_g1~~TRINITY_DN1183_c0_g1_i2.p4  ORF type:complete len:114 (-),score=5.29 TRINITY_DN1183_c0_g1_i2:528-869(-)